MTDNDPFLKELQQRAERAHKSTDRADDVPPELWQRVRSHVKTEEEESPSMSSITMPASPAPLSQPAAPVKSRGIGHYANLAATIAVVVGVALAGWFATMQLNQPGGSNGQFAFLGQSDENATCEVEPLTVERVMEIVKNPLPFMENGPAGDPVNPENPDDLLNLEHYEAGDLGVELTFHRSGETPSDDEFNTVTEIADAYLQCLIHGTRGQVWTFYSPADIQRDVLREFQVFADEEQVRQRVAERVDLPAHEYDALWSTYDYGWGETVATYNPANAYVNQDPGLALHREHLQSHYEFMVTAGVSLEDAEGKQVFLTTGTGNVLILDRQVGGYQLTVTVAKHGWYDQWYVIPISTY